MKIKNKILSSFLLTAAFTFIFATVSSVSIFAAVEVYLDGTKLHYKEAQPQIINDWTMVPLTETATLFEMTPTWDSKTRTMVFTSSGRTMVHTINDNKISVNGITVPFEENCRSTIVNDRTLMPIRMLSESIGAKIEWDFYGDDLVIDIWTNAGDSTPASVAQEEQPTPTPAPVQAQTPTNAIEIYSVAQSRSTIEAGQSFRLSVDTNEYATMVKVTDFDGNLLEEVTDFEEDERDQVRYFNFSLKPEEIGEVSLKIYAGNEDGYSLASKNLTVQVEGIVKTIFIENIKLSSNSIAPGKDVDLLFYTSKNVTRVTVSDDTGVLRRLTKPVNTTNNYFVWETYLYAENKVGDYTYVITAYDINGANESEDVVLSVKNASSSISSDGVIQSMTYKKANAGDRCYITVITTDKVEEIEMKDHNDDVILSTSRPVETSGSKRTWEFHFRPDDSASYYIYVYDADDKKLEDKTLFIEVN